MDCVVKHIEQMTEKICSMVLEFDAPVACAPGQFLHILCGEGQMLRRPISICDAQGCCRRIVFEVKGEGTQWLSHRQVGDKLDSLPPKGHGFDTSGKVLLVGGGIGVPPMLLCAKSAGSAAAVLGFRNAGAVILEEDFKALCEMVDITTEDGSYGEQGFLTAPLERRLQEEKFDRVLACGPKPMLKAVYNTAKKYGVPCFVSMEERMGCGIGACLVCACSIGGHMKHVCKDGPVFDGNEVDWDA